MNNRNTSTPAMLPMGVLMGLLCMGTGCVPASTEEAMPSLTSAFCAFVADFARQALAAWLV